MLIIHNQILSVLSSFKFSKQPNTILDCLKSPGEKKQVHGVYLIFLMYFVFIWLESKLEITY